MCCKWYYDFVWECFFVRFLCLYLDFDEEDDEIDFDFEESEEEEDEDDCCEILRF